MCSLDVRIFNTKSPSPQPTRKQSSDGTDTFKRSSRVAEEIHMSSKTCWLRHSVPITGRTSLRSPFSFARDPAKWPKHRSTHQWLRHTHRTHRITLSFSNPCPKTVQTDGYLGCFALNKLQKSMSTTCSFKQTVVSLHTSEEFQDVSSISIRPASLVPEFCSTRSQGHLWLSTPERSRSSTGQLSAPLSNVTCYS